MNQELLAVLGVIVTITLASSASLHLELNKLEDDTGDSFEEARFAIKMCAYSLLVVFVLAGALVMSKPTAAPSQTVSALFNTGAILLMVFSIGVLADLTSAIFDIPSVSKIRSRRGER